MPLQLTARLPLAIIVVVLIFVTALVAFWLSKPSIEEIGWEEREHSWQQVEPIFKALDPSSLKIVFNRQLWGLNDSEEDKNKLVTWSVNGIISENGIRSFIAIIELRKDGKVQKEIKRYSLGDIMPNGEMVVSINKDSVVYETDGEKLEKHLYEAASSKGEKGL